MCGKSLASVSYFHCPITAEEWSMDGMRDGNFNPQREIKTAELYQKIFYSHYIDKC